MIYIIYEAMVAACGVFSLNKKKTAKFASKTYINH